MSNPFVGEVRLFAGNFAPANWSFCDGSLLSIAEFTTLFELIGTTYGGDGQTTFALPDLRGRVPVHQGAGSVIGQSGGSETVTLTLNQMPRHSHVLNATPAGATLGAPGDAMLATTSANTYGPGPGTAALAPAAIGPQGGLQGGTQAHENMAPFTALSYIISLFGIFPSQN